MDIAALQPIRPAAAVLLSAARAHPEVPRFYVRRGDRWDPVTWGELARQVRAVAAQLIGDGIAPGDRVAVFAHNSVAWVAAALGIQAAGAVLVPIYPSSTAEQVGYVLDHAGAAAVFAGDAERARVRHRRRYSLDEGGALPFSELVARGATADAAAPGRVDERLAAAELGDTCLLLYTSGTSGPPKGVPLSHENLGANASDWLEANAPLLHPDAVDLLWLPMSHVFGFGELCLGNTLGFTSYLASPRDVLEHLPEVAPTVFFSVPAYWKKLAEPALAEPDPARRLDIVRRSTGGRLRFCLSGGAGLEREVKELFHAAGTLIIEGYGLTECAPTLTLNRADDFRFDSVGKPLASVELELADDGEILARGPNVFSGYFRDPEATAAAFTEDGWFRTGDVGRLTGDGFLQIVDRKKDILVTAGGKNVPPANVERRFDAEPLIEHLVVYGDGKKYLVAGVWPSAHARAACEPGELRERLRAVIARENRALSSCETIKRFAILDRPLSVESGLLTASLKVRRKAVYAAFAPVFEALYDDPSASVEDPR